MRKNDCVGEENINYQGCLMKIVRYNGFKDVLVEFQDIYKDKTHTRYDDFLKGRVQNHYYPDTFGIGISGRQIKFNDKSLPNKEYRTWFNVLQRCYDKDFKDKHPTYMNATCCEEWLLYDNFYEWIHSQDNFNQWSILKRSSIDKDILVKGNKIYSPDTCCLVTDRVNILFTKRDSERGDCPIGVSKHNNKFRAQFTMNGKHISFPVRDNPSDCFYLDYKPFKENLIKQVAEEELKNGNITKVCYEAMMKYEVEITD